MHLPTARRHIVTVGLEDFFQVDAFDRLIAPRQWSRFERRLERSTARTLDLLDDAGARATFFVLGWIADIAPELVRSIAARGHEIASRGYDHRSVSTLDREEFRDDLARAREAIERAAGIRVRGHRAARLWYSRRDLWALDVLAEQGYAYDSSLAPFLRRFSHEPWRRRAHKTGTNHGSIWELPVSSTQVMGLSLPVAGGNYARQLPERFVHQRVDRWMRDEQAPFIMYFHVWELDPDQPRVAAPLLQRVRQYRNLDRMREFLSTWLASHQFGTAAEFLGLDATAARPLPAPAALPAAPVAVPAEARRTPVTVVVPCFNEEQTLPFLRNTLADVSLSLDSTYALQYILVDDGSTDETWAVLQRLFGGRPDVVLVRHPRNHGIAAAIRTGILRSRTEVVCSIDCDCSYDPLRLAEMLPLLGPGVDMVTASPYHPEGQVRNVPAWRLVLSRSLSGLYRRLLGSSLSTYTSCFRVYRRSAVAACRVDRGGFLGVAELLGRMILRGHTVVEYPATLEVRVLGRSKLRVARTVAGHLGLAAAFTAVRARMAVAGAIRRAFGLSARRISEIPASGAI